MNGSAQNSQQQPKRIAPILVSFVILALILIGAFYWYQKTRAPKPLTEEEILDLISAPNGDPNALPAADPQAIRNLTAP